MISERASGPADPLKPVVERARNGDPAAQEELHQVLRQQARALCRGGGPGGGFDADWEDVAQVAGETLFRIGLDRYRGGSVRGYLYAIAKHTLLRMARERRRRREREQKTQTQGTAPEAPHSHLDIQSILSRLSEECRDLLIRVYLWDVSYRKMAEALNMAESSVRSKVTRCLQRARLQVLEREAE